MTHVWFQRLNAAHLAWAAWTARGGAVTVFAAQCSPWARRLGAALRRCGLDLVVEPVQLEMGEVDAGGLVIRYAIEAEASRLAAQLAAELGDLAPYLPAQYRNHADDWMRILRANFVGHALTALTFMVAAGNRYATGRVSAPADGKVIYCPQVPFLPGLFARTRINGAAARVVPWRRLSSLFGLAPFPGILLRDLLTAMRAQRRGTPAREIPAAAVAAGTVLEQYCPGLLELYPDGGHLFWHKSSGLPAERVVMLCNREDGPADGATTSLFRRFGLSWVDGGSVHGFLARPLADTLRHMATAWWAGRGGRGETAAWRRVLVAQYAPMLEGYRRLARQLNVTLLHQNEEQAARPLLTVLAVRMEGGAFIWNHWSVSHLPVAREASGMADLLLAWGSYDLGFRAAMNFRFARAAIVGTVYAQPAKPDLTRRAATHRARLAPGVRFVLAVFDSSHGPDCHQPTATLEAFIHELLAAAAARADWGILYKAKSPRTEALLDTGLAAPLTRLLEDEGRLVRVTSSASPEEAAAGSDLSVCYSINSAGISAAVNAGARVVHADLAGMGLHPLYAMGAEGRVVFRTMPALTAAIAQAASGARDIGDMAPFLARFDAFCDQHGNDRAGALMGEYLRGRDGGLDVDTALDQALAVHAAAWGAAAAPGPEQVAEATGLWRQSLAGLDFCRLHLAAAE